MLSISHTNKNNTCSYDCPFLDELSYNEGDLSYYCFLMRKVLSTYDIILGPESIC